MIPESALKKGTELAQGATIFGTLITEMTKEELIAMAALGWKTANEARDAAYETHRRLAAVYKGATR